MRDCDALFPHVLVSPAEDQNYTLFNYVNEVNTEIEALEDQITVIRKEVGSSRQGNSFAECT
jgi:hypothetical protein